MKELSEILIAPIIVVVAGAGLIFGQLYLDQRSEAQIGPPATAVASLER